MGNGALSSPRGSQQLSRKDFENLEKMCRNSHFRDHFDDYKVTFHKAIDNDAIDMIELLIPAGNSKRLRPLHIACKLAKLESAELLISAGFSCVLLDEMGRTPLHLCCTSRSLEAGLCATLLVLASKKALTVRDSEGLTPLHLAAAQNNLHVIQALMNNGADVTITSAAGDSPYQVAMDNRNYEALNLLKDIVSNKNKSKKLSKQSTNTQQYLAPMARPKEQTQAEVDRIMQVWERFFENAFKRMGIDPNDLEDEPAPPPRSHSSSHSRPHAHAQDADRAGYHNRLHNQPRYDNWTSEDYFGELHHYAEPSVAAKKRSGESDAKGVREGHGSEWKDWVDGHPEYDHSSKTLTTSSRSAYPATYDASYEDSYGTAYDYNYTNSYYFPSAEAPYAAAENDWYEGSLDPSYNAQRVVDWFDWVVFYEEATDPEAEEGAYYVLSKSSGETQWLEDHVEAFRRSTLLPCGDWHDYELHMSHPLPTTLLETIARGWLTYYEAAESACKWINLPTKSIETLLPVGIGEHAQVLSDLGLAVCDSDSRYYSADQTCARAWVLVIGFSAAGTAPLDWKTDEDAQETVYYYRNRITGETSWQPPGNWHELVASWDNWTLCCNEDTCDDLYWYDFESGESMWVEL